MQAVLKLLLGITAIIAALLAFSPKKEKIGRSIQVSTPHIYYYYPKANFYYDSTDSKYLYWDSAAAVWQSTDKLPVQQGDMGKTVRIGETVGPVWNENQHHRLIYSVSLYSAPQDFKKEEKVVANTSPKPLTGDSAKAVKKSGVKKFLERIFPPKKKKDSVKN